MSDKILIEKREGVDTLLTPIKGRDGVFPYKRDGKKVNKKMGYYRAGILPHFERLFKDRDGKTREAESVHKALKIGFWGFTVDQIEVNGEVFHDIQTVSLADVGDYDFWKFIEWLDQYSWEEFDCGIPETWRHKINYECSE